MLKRVPTAKEILIKGPGHFIQEEAGPEMHNSLLTLSTEIHSHSK